MNQLFGVDYIIPIYADMSAHRAIGMQELLFILSISFPRAPQTTKA